MALADAGIPMCDIVTSCSAGYLNSTPLLGKSIIFLSYTLLNSLYVSGLLKTVSNADLNYVEDSAGGPDVTVGILPKSTKVTLLQVYFGFFKSYAFSD